MEKQMKSQLLDQYMQYVTQQDRVDESLYRKYDVKRGLRDLNGRGVVTGITNISRIEAFDNIDGKEIPAEGRLWYRGINVEDLVSNSEGRRFLFEETAYLLLFGSLPSQSQLDEFVGLLASYRSLPSNFTRDVIMKAPSKDLMNSLTKSILTLANYDDTVGRGDLKTQLEQCIKLIAVMPLLAAYGYHAYNYSVNNGSLYIHRPEENLSAAENLLMLLRPDQSYTKLEARELDIAMLLHMEHGGGNNSSFTTRVVTSSGADTYSVIAAALCSLKGPKHGGANLRVMQMMDDIRSHVRDTADEEEVEAYIGKILDGDAFDRKGLIYGLGHAVYSLSDPRAEIFRRYVERLAAAKGKEKEFQLYSLVEHKAARMISERRKIYKGVCVNVDFYSGFAYEMLGIPRELYTPLFAISRIAGWSAHRLEELVNTDKIIRPAYVSCMEKKEYIPIENRS